MQPSKTTWAFRLRSGGKEGEREREKESQCSPEGLVELPSRRGPGVTGRTTSAVNSVHQLLRHGSVQLRTSCASSSERNVSAHSALSSSRKCRAEDLALTRGCCCRKRREPDPQVLLRPPPTLHPRTCAARWRSSSLRPILALPARLEHADPLGSSHSFPRLHHLGQRPVVLGELAQWRGRVLQAAAHRLHPGGRPGLSGRWLPRLRDQNPDLGPAGGAGGQTGELLRAALVQPFQEPADDRQVRGHVVHQGALRGVQLCDTSPDKWHFW